MWGELIVRGSIYHYITAIVFCATHSPCLYAGSFFSAQFPASNFARRLSTITLDLRTSISSLGLRSSTCASSRSSSSITYLSTLFLPSACSVCSVSLKGRGREGEGEREVEKKTQRNQCSPFRSPIITSSTTIQSRSHYLPRRQKDAA